MSTSTDSKPLIYWEHDGPNGILSNWSPHSFEYAGTTFPTAEHAIMHAKATMMGDQESATAVLATQHPRDVKKLGRGVKNYDDGLWVSKRSDVLYDILAAKAHGHKEILQLLRDSGDRVIGEANSADRVWAIGFAVDDPKALDTSNWGDNLMGKTWMRVRDTLKST